ncbi:MAG: DNA mismatch repair protein MutT [Celeribacter sp.]|jgi:8-oxo-dGTP pyrophosphatase MutT (NUDIX family)
MARGDLGPALRHAATLIVHRHGPEGAEVLMGQRGRAAAFMPSKFVFPGGAVDPGDAQVPLAGALSPACRARLSVEGACEGGPVMDRLPDALVAAAIRELWEETGLMLARPDPWSAEDLAVIPAGWEDFAKAGMRPDAGACRFVFRAVTPLARSRRFDARFFVASAAAVMGDVDDFSRAQPELSGVQWVPLARARNFDLPFITTVVLAELSHLLSQADPVIPADVPFVRNDDIVSNIRRLR